jgi:TonB family protein
MKRLFYTIVFVFIISVVFPQHPRTTLVVNDSGGNFVKEIYLVRADDQNIKEGTWQQFFDEKLITKGRYSNNKKDGKWEFYDYSGEIDFTGFYADDKKDGRWEYKLNGNLSAEIFYHNGIADSIFGFFDNGNKALEVWRYPDGKGLIKTYYDNGSVKEVQPTLNGRPHGNYEVYFKNGILHRRVKFREAQIVSVLETFNMKGEMIDGGSLNNGNGTLVSYFIHDDANEQPMQKYLNLGFKDGVVNGIASHYYVNGNLKSSGFTENGITTGEWKYYKEDGEVMHIINYDYNPFSESRRQISPEVFSGNDINTGQRNPSFMGGGEEWLAFLEKTIRYPNDAADYPALGIVHVEFVVTDVGDVVSGHVVKSVNKPLDDEALRVLEEMPRWNPGLNYGIPVSMQMNMPLSFNIE